MKFMLIVLQCRELRKFLNYIEERIVIEYKADGLFKFQERGLTPPSLEGIRF